MGVFDYSPSAFNELPSLGKALDIYEREGVAQHISTSICDIFLRHDARKRYALSLLHRHFRMHDSERLLHIGNVAMPWKYSQGSDDNSVMFDGKATAVQWRFVAGEGEYEGARGLVPYEFELNEAGKCGGMSNDSNADADADFLEDLYGYLSEHGLLSYIGLSAMPSSSSAVAEEEDEDGCKGSPAPPTVEITNGRHNIVFPGGEDTVGSRKAAEVSWVFSEGPLVN
ncbi:hypothetical protein PG995_004149 [Apiospora arundinis]